MCCIANAAFSLSSYLSSEPELRDGDMDDDNVTMGNDPWLDIIHSHLQCKVPGASDRFQLPNHTWGRTQTGISDWNSVMGETYST